MIKIVTKMSYRRNGIERKRKNLDLNKKMVR